MKPKIVFKNSGRIRRIVDKIRKKSQKVDPASFVKTETPSDKLYRYRQNGIGNIREQRRQQRLADEARQMRKIRNGVVLGGTALTAYHMGKKKGTEQTERRIYGG